MCCCELVDGRPRSMSTLKRISGPTRIGSIREVAEYECTQCGARFSAVHDDWSGDTFERTPPEQLS